MFYFFFFLWRRVKNRVRPYLLPSQSGVLGPNALEDNGNRDFTVGSGAGGWG